MRDFDRPGIVHSFVANKTGRDFVVGDIHGHFDLLHALMTRVRFDYNSDRLYAVGDVIDRGAQSQQVVGWLTKRWFHSVRGNHEQMIIDCTDGDGDIPRHSRNGGAWFYSLSATAQASIATALRELPLAMELELSNGNRVGIIHAEAPLLNASDDWQQGMAALTGQRGQDALHAAKNLALYARMKFDNRDDAITNGIETLYVGHTTVPTITRLGNTVYMDTGCSFSDGALSILELDTGSVTTMA